MSVSFQLADAAQEEHLEAIRFYRKQSVKVATAFSEEFEYVATLLTQRPLLGSPHQNGTRRQLFPTFPYSFIYIFEDDLITVYAVAHHRRDPDYWIKRLPDQD